MFLGEIEPVGSGVHIYDWHIKKTRKMAQSKINSKISY